MKLLQVIGTLNPVYGGPVEALRQMTVALEELGHRSETVTLDARDVPWIGSFPGVIHALGPSRGKYRYNSRLIPWLETHYAQYDAVIACGIWQYQSLAVSRTSRRAGFPYFVFVHGALDPWFRRAFPIKHLKKWLYWLWAEYQILRNASAVLFRSDAERLLARKSFWLYRVHEAVVDNGIRTPGGDPAAQREIFLNMFPGLCDKRLLLFLSRIHEKKGCDLLIEAFAQMSDHDPRLHLVMAGPDQGDWQRKLETLAQERGIAKRITWTGMLTGDLKWGAFRAAEVFVLPSHSENFGMVVAESLACGVPVLVTDKVNIWREIMEDGAGLVASDTEVGVIELLKGWLALSADEKARMRKQAQICFFSHFEIHKAAEKLIQVVEKRIRRNIEKTSASPLGASPPP